MRYLRLAHRALIACSGEDVPAFLQGLVSNDVSRLKKGEAVYAALLTPQGKFLHDFFLLPWQNSILVDCDRPSLPDLWQRLNMYKLRSKVTVAAKEDIGVVALWGDKDSGFGIQDSGFEVFPDPRLPQLGYRIVGETAAIEAWCVDRKMDQSSIEEYDRLRLELGIPEGTRDMIQNKSLLLEFGFEDLHGVDFKKGCYVGQEVTARSKYRGQVRRFIYQVRAANGTLPPPGTPVMLDDAPIGELRSSAGNIGLALLKVAEVEKANATRAGLRIGDIPLTASIPPWVTHPPVALTMEE